MTTETETSNTVDPTKEQADAEAAFSAGFDGKEAPPAAEKQPPEAPKPEATPTPTPAPKPAPAATPTPTPTATPESSAAPSPAPRPSPEVEELRRELREVHGRFGEVNRTLKELQAQRTAEGKPAVATALELKRMKEAYPELAEDLSADLAQAMEAIQGRQADPKAIEEMVSQRVSSEVSRMRDGAVEASHPTWKSDLFTAVTDTSGRVVKKPSADYLAWQQAIGADEVRAFESSDNPWFVIKKLDSFYEFKRKAVQAAEAAAKAEAERTKRLQAAVTPQGVPRASPPTQSDDEAMRKGFEEGFNS